MRDRSEADFVGWIPPSQIAKNYRLSRSTIYLHAKATRLDAEREKNVRAALGSFIERCARVRPTAAAFVSACVALTKLNEKGETVDRIAAGGPQQFVGWTRGELELFVRDGTLPDRFVDKSLTATLSPQLKAQEQENAAESEE